MSSLSLGFFSKIANLFPSIVTGSVITTIGLTLIPVAIGNMGDNAPKPTVQSLILAVVTILIILVVNIYTTGFIKSISILIGLIVGTAIAASMGLVDFTPERKHQSFTFQHLSSLEPLSLKSPPSS